jgi:hypothetical protein
MEMRSTRLIMSSPVSASTSILRRALSQHVELFVSQEVALEQEDDASVDLARRRQTRKVADVRGRQNPVFSER